MATKQLYFKNVTANGALSLQDGGTAPTPAITTTGWAVGKIAANNYSLMAVGSERLTTTFGATSTLATPAFSAGSCWRSELPYAGTFANANWIFTFSVRAVSASAAQLGRVRMRVWKSANADGTGAVELTTAVQVGGILAGVPTTTASQTSSVTWVPGAAFTFNNEYLWVQCEWMITTAGSNNSSDIDFYISGAVGIATADFASSGWSTTDKVGTITYSNGDKTATYTNTGQLRSSALRQHGVAGKYYVEFLHGGDKTGRVGVHDVAQSISNGSYGHWVYDAGDVAILGITAGTTIGPLLASRVTCTAWDTSAKKIWFRRDGGYWNGVATDNPATGTGGLSTAGSANTNHALYSVAIQANTAHTCRTQNADLTFKDGSIAGFTSWMGDALTIPSVADAWDYNDKSAPVTLTNSDKTASVATSSSNGVHSTQARKVGTAGKYYAEILCNTVGGINVYIGIQKTSQDETGVPNSMCLTGSSQFVINSVGGTTLGRNLANGDVICLAWDAVAEKFWARFNNGLWNNDAAADPATGTNGKDASFTTTGDDYSLWVRFNYIGDSFTVRTELADLTLQGPAGFTTWMGETIPLPSTADAWNVNDQFNAVLSNNDKTTSSAAGSTQIRSTKTVPASSASDKFYFEILVGSPGFDGNTRFGATDLTAGIAATYLFQLVGKSFCIGANGLYVDGNLVTASVQLQPTTELICFAFDTVNKRGWVRRGIAGANGYWNGSATADPATNTEGLDLSSFSGAFAIGASLQVGGGSATVRTEKDELTQVTPTGFLSWMGETLVSPDAGTLASGAADLDAVGVSGASGTGALVAVNTTGQRGAGLSTSSGTATLAAMPLLRTNLVTQSQTFDHADWIKFGTTIGPNLAFSPGFDFTATADILQTASAANEEHRVLNSTAVEPFSVNTFSVYAKSSLTTWLQLAYDGVSQNYNLANGTLGNKTGAGTATITNEGSGWYRCTLTRSNTGQNPTYPNIILIQDDTTQNTPPFANANCSVHIWGAQFESGSAATAYIPTTSATVSVGGFLNGTGVVRWNATGALVAGVADLDAVGQVVSAPATGTGTLTSVATLAGVGVVTNYTWTRPGSDVATDGWTDQAGGASNIYTTLDEPYAANDSDYVKSPTGAGDLVVRLFEGSTQIATWSHVNPPDTFTTAEQTLTTPQYAAISDFSNLFVEFDDSQSNVYRFKLGATTFADPPVTLRYRYKKTA